MNRIRKLRKEMNMKQLELCEKLGIVQATLSGWENEKYEPDLKSIKRMAEIFNVSIDYLLGESNRPVSEHNVFEIPVLGTVQAGIPMEAIENIIDYEEISEEMARSGEYFGLRVKGSSMEPKFSEGDVVIVRKQPDAENGEIAIILVNGSEATIKKIKKDSNGIMLIPSNPNYEVQFYDKKDIEEKPVQIIGKVVELRAKF